MNDHSESRRTSSSSKTSASSTNASNQPQASGENSIQFQLDKIADDYMIRRRAGENPSFESYQLAHPEIADQIGALLETIQFVNDMGEETCDGTSLSDELRSPEPQTPSSIGFYEILGKLGQGGMGTVYRAKHKKLNRIVAIKMLPASKVGREDIARFEREMASTGQLNHPNIVVAHDAGEINGQHFLVMELLDGHDLGKVSDSCGPLDPATACELVRQAALGLQCAYESGIVHRDIKPSNLMLTSEGVVKILDLGLARFHGDPSQDEITSTGQVMGSLNYIAPEQCINSSSVDIRADIFGLGSTLYKLLTGVAPYTDPKLVTTMEKLLAINAGSPPSIRTRRSDLPNELVRIVDRSITHDPEKRFSCPQEFADALVPFADPADMLSVLQQTNGQGHDAALQDTFTCKQSLVDTSRSHTQNASDPIPTKQFPGRKSAIVTLVALIALGFAALPFAYPAIMSLVTDDGTIIVETKGGQIPVTMNDQSVTFTDPSDGKQVTVSIDKSRDLLLFAKPGFTATGKSYELAHREKKVSIRFRPKENVVQPEKKSEEQANPAPASAPISNTTNHSTVNKPDPERLQALEWAFDNGLMIVGVEGENVASRPSDVLRTSKPWNRLQVFSRGKRQVARVLEVLSPFAKPSELRISGSFPADKELFDQIAKMQKLVSLGFTCPVDPVLFFELPDTLTSRLTSFGTRNTADNSPINDQFVQQLAKRCPNLESLNIHASYLGKSAVESLSSLPITTLEIYVPTQEFVESLDLLVSVEEVMLHYRGATGAKDNFDYMPPNVNFLRLWYCDLTEDSFAALRKYDHLNRITLYKCNVNLSAARAFKAERPDFRLQDWQTGQEIDLD